MSVLAFAFVQACTSDDGPPAAQPVDESAPTRETPDAASAADGANADVSAGDTGAGPSDASSEADAADAADGNTCKATPSSCTSAAKLCANMCHVTYNNCINACSGSADLMGCVDTCKSQQTTCEVPCKGDCVTCANTALSCTGGPDCEAQMFRN